MGFFKLRFQERENKDNCAIRLSVDGETQCNLASSKWPMVVWFYYAFFAEKCQLPDLLFQLCQGSIVYLIAKRKRFVQTKVAIFPYQLVLELMETFVDLLKSSVLACAMLFFSVLGCPSINKSIQTGPKCNENVIRFQDILQSLRSTNLLFVSSVAILPFPLPSPSSQIQKGNIGSEKGIRGDC